MSVNKKIKKYIQTKGITTVFVAKKIGTSQPNISRILNANDLKVSKLIELSKLLDVSPAYFFDPGDENSKLQESRWNNQNVLIEQQGRHIGQLENTIQLLSNQLKKQ